MNKKPWLHKGSPWKSEASYWSWLRGQIRRIWSKYPIATNFKNSMCRKATKADKLKYSLHPSTKLIGQCQQCKRWYAKSKLQIDHITPSEGCTSYETAHSFLDHNTMVGPEDLQLLCTECHKIKSHADNKGLSIEEAKEDKKKIAFFKQDLGDIKRQLKELGATEEDLKNAKTREAFYKRRVM